MVFLHMGVHGKPSQSLIRLLTEKCSFITGTFLLLHSCKYNSSLCFCSFYLSSIICLLQIGDSLLHVAINTGSFEIIDYLVTEHGLDVNEGNVVSAPLSIIAIAIVRTC